MTRTDSIFESLKSKGIEIEKCESGICAIAGTTPNGNHFYIDQACGTFREVSVSISKDYEGIYYCSHCLPRTAISKVLNY